jgi:hypothetical protein
MASEKQRHRQSVLLPSVPSRSSAPDRLREELNKSMVSNVSSQMQKQQKTAVVSRCNTAVFHWRTCSNVILIWVKLLDLEDMNSHRIIHCLKDSVGVSSSWNAMSGFYSSFVCFLIVLVNHHEQLQEFQLLSEQHGIEHLQIFSIFIVFCGICVGLNMLQHLNAIVWLQACVC